MWQKYFKLIKIVPGPVIIPGRGMIDFSNPGLSLNLVKQLFEDDCPYLKPTSLALSEFYGVPTQQITPATEPGNVPKDEPIENAQIPEPPSTDHIESQPAPAPAPSFPKGGIETGKGDTPTLKKLNKKKPRQRV